MNLETLKESYETYHTASGIIADIMIELSDLPCPNSYGFEGAGTFSDCGDCIICLSKDFIDYYKLEEE